MGNADITIKEIWISLDILKQWSVSFYRKVSHRLEGFPCQAVYRKMNILSDVQGPPSASFSYCRSSAAYHTANSGRLTYLNILFFTISPHSTVLDGAPSNALTVPNSLTLLQDSFATPSLSLCSFQACVQELETIITTFSRFVNCRTYSLLCTLQMILLQKLDVFMTIRSKLRACAIQYGASGEKNDHALGLSRQSQGYTRQLWCMWK